MQRFKRIFACLLAFVLLTVASVPAVAVTDEDVALRKKITSHYYSALAGTGKKTLGGYCGLMTSWQLYLLGVTKHLEVNDGNKQYDYYKDMEYTSGGHRVKVYPAEEYTLEEALYAATGYGIRNAYNLVVGFQWTSTAAGATYGHAVVIYAIMDGKVYFTEGFSTSMGTSEGQAIVLSIPEFVQYYADWTRYEGTIEFGMKDRAYTLEKYAVEAYYKAVEKTQMYAQPANDKQTQVLRKVDPQERLYVTGILEDADANYFFQITEDNQIGYIPVEKLELLAMRQIVPVVHKAELPRRVETGKSPAMEISLTLPDACTAELVLQGENGEVLVSTPMTLKNDCWQASGDVLGIRDLEDGAYRVCVDASRGQGAMIYGGPVTILQKETVLELPICVGETAQIVQTKTEEAFTDGWNYRNDTWYYYKDGAPYVGWLCQQGKDYYLKQDGSITTGWTEVLGKPRYFNNMGVMRTGWLEDGGNTYYLMCNGVPVQGWREIDGKRYCFDDNGVMYRDAWLEEEGKTRYLQMDGTPIAEGWQDTVYGRLLFDTDGFVEAQRVEQDGKTAIVPWMPEQNGVQTE